jgi:hypothetical protein
VRITTERQDGTLRAGGRRRRAVHQRVDEAHRRKYGRLGASYVGLTTGPEAIASTLRLAPISLPTVASIERNH